MNLTKVHAAVDALDAWLAAVSNLSPEEFAALRRVLRARNGYEI